MKIDETILRAYVDAELAPKQRDHVEAVLAHDADLRAQVQALRASCLPYRTAFESETMPAMPVSLQAQLASWTALAASASATAFGQLAQPVSRRRWLGLGAGMGVGLAASFAAGVLVRLPQTDGTMDMLNDSPWVSAIANYQALYVRATVDQPVDDQTRVERVLADFSATTRTTVAVPNLMEVGLSFKRIQRLGYEDRPLLQMIFLPPQGKPTALCVLPAELKDAAIKQSTRNGMQVVSWRRRGMAYVLVTDLSEKNATSVALKLMSDAYPAVYRS